jgi:hypothetical protein
MRRIKETLILCCAAAILAFFLPNQCRAQTQTVKVSGNSLLIIPVFQPRVPGMEPPKPEALRRALHLLESQNQTPQTTTSSSNAAGLTSNIQIISIKKPAIMPIAQTIVLPVASLTNPKLTEEIAKKKVTALFGKSGITPLSTVVGPSGAEGKTIYVTSGVPATVSTDQGFCQVTATPTFSYSFDMNCGQRSISYASTGYYADPITLTVETGKRYKNVDAYFANTSTAGAINGAIANVTPSTTDCIEVTLSEEGSCDPVVRSMSASKQNGYKFSFEDLEAGITYKVAITDASCAPPTFEISRTFSISGTPPRHTWTLNSLNCPY